MVKDAQDNELNEGDTVSLQAPSQLVVGEITKIIQGGLIAGAGVKGQPRVMASEVVIVVAFKLTANPDAPWLPNVLKLHQKDKGEKGLIELPN